MVKRKVLFVIDTLEFGGAEQSLLANAVRFQRIEPVVCHVYKGSTLKSKFEECGISVYSLGIEKKYGFVKAYQELLKVVNREQPELIVAYLTRSEIVSRLVGKFNHIPVIGTFVNDLYCPTYNRNLSWKSKKVVQAFKMINRLTCKVCVGFISNSISIKDANAKHLHIPLNKVTVINRGRDSSKIRRKDPDSLNGTASIRFLNVSRLFYVKGQMKLLAGFKKFLEKVPSASLTIVGEGPMRKELTEFIVNNDLTGSVFLLGSRNDVPALLSDFDCFVFPSLSEGFSGAVVEAMFAGLPILASDISQNEEVVTHAETAYLFSRDSAEAVEQAMLWFKDNRSIAREYAIKAYNDAKKRFELNKIAAQLENYLCNKISEIN